MHPQRKFARDLHRRGCREFSPASGHLLIPQFGPLSLVASLPALEQLLDDWRSLHSASAHPHGVSRAPTGAWPGRAAILVPLFAVVGSCIYRSSSRNAYLYCYVGFAILSSFLATAEHFLGRSLFGRTEYFNRVTRDGQFRGLAGAEHVLVLGTLICIAIPLALSQINKYRLLVAVVLIVGCWSTGSLGPTATGILVSVCWCGTWHSRLAEKPSDVDALGAGRRPAYAGLPIDQRVVDDDQRYIGA